MALVAHRRHAEELRAVPALLRRLPHLSRDSEDRRDRLTRTWPSCSRLRRLPSFRARALNPEHPHHRRHRAEPGHLLPGPRGWQQVLQRRSGDCGRGHGRGRRDHRPPATSRLTTSALRMRSTSSSAMGSGCDVATEAINYLNEMGEKVGLVKRSPVSSVLHQALRGRHPGDLQDASPCSTAPRSPAPWASRSTSTSAPPSSRKAARSRSSAAATAWAPRSSTPTHGQGCV